MAGVNGNTFLPMWGIPDQIPSRATATTSKTNVGRGGVIDAAAALGRQVFETIKLARGERAHVQAIDDLNPGRLSKMAMTAITSLAQFESTPMTLAEVNERYEVLKHVAAGTASRDAREIAEAVQKVVEGRTAEVRAGFGKLFDQQPADVVDAVVQGRQQLNDYTPPRGNLKLLAKLRRILQRLHELPQFETSLVPGTYQGVRTALLQEARKATEEALVEVIDGQTWAALQDKRPTLEVFFKEIQARGVKFQTQVSAVVDDLAEKQQEARQQEQEMASSATLTLPGPDKDEVLTGMRTVAGCAEVSALVELLVPEFDAALRTFARHHYPHLDAQNASFATLNVEIRSGEIAEILVRLVESRLGTGHSLYQLVERYGIAKCAEYLVQRAGATCFFAGRTEHRFGFTPMEFAILRMPPAKDSADEEVRELFRGEVEHLAPNLHVDEGNDLDREISITRFFCGWIIGTEAANGALLQHYAFAGDEGHPPHLVGIVSDSPLGKVSPAYRNLLPIDDISEESETPENGAK